MKFGLMYEIQIPEPHYPGIERDVYRQVLDQVTLADAVGFDYFWTVEHHFLKEFSHCPAPEVLHYIRHPGRCGHRAEDDKRDRQSRETGVRRQHLSGEPAHYEDKRHLCTQDSLRGDQNDHIASGTRVYD